MSNLWFNYVWASLKGNGPEAIVQTIVYGLIAIIFVPPVRRWFNCHMKAVHEKLDHVIFHSPEIPPFDPENPEPVAVKPPARRPRKAPARPR